ncbi:hypothetical protein ACKKBF_B00790 [Auxenochlorella protothecoides x Auxenochlorella symbiontica]
MYGGSHADPMDTSRYAPSSGAGTRGTGQRENQFVPGKVFLGGMSNQTTSEGLREYAEQWGHVKDAYVMTGKGYAFVTFEDVASARSFLEKREHELDGKVAEAKAAVPKDQGGSKLTKKMFVGGIGDVSDEAFASYFSQFGNAVTCTVLRRPDGSSKNYGFVTFDDEMSVEKCLLGQHTLNGRQVQVRRAHPRDSGGGERGGEGRAGDQGRGPGGPPPGPLMFAGQAGPQSQGQMPMGMPDPSAMLAMAQMHPAAFMGMPGMGMYGMMPGMMGMFPGMGGGQGGMMPGAMMPGAMLPGQGGMMPGAMLPGQGGMMPGAMMPGQGGMMPGHPMMMGGFGPGPMMSTAGGTEAANPGGSGRGAGEASPAALNRGGGGAAGQGNDGPWSGGPSSSNWGGQGQPQGRRGEGGDRQPRQGGGREGRQDSRGPSGYGRANIGGGPSQRGGGNPSSQRFRPY